MSTLSPLNPSDLAHNLLVGEDVTIADDAEIGANVVIYDEVRVGPGVLIQHGAVLGRTSTYRRGSSEPPPVPGETIVEEGAIIGNYVLVSAGARLAPHAFVGDHAVIRQGVSLGVDTMIGCGCTAARNVEIGDRTRIQATTILGAEVVIEQDCFLGPGVHVLTGRTMGTPPRSSRPILRRGCQIGAGAKILPGVEIGEEAVVGAGAVVVRDVAPGARVKGMPARES
jgi:acetyltransferase-like isoleucine patch superfamily enzyme